MLWPVVWIVSKPAVIALSKATLELSSFELVKLFGCAYIGGMFSIKIGEHAYHYLYSFSSSEESPLAQQEQKIQVIKDNLLAKVHQSENLHEDASKKIEQVEETVDEIKHLILKISENIQPLLDLLNEMPKKEEIVELPSLYLLIMKDFIKKIQDLGLDELVEELKQSRQREEHLIEKLSFFVSKYEQMKAQEIGAKSFIL